ncbi:MAG: hypothetical protein A3E79_17720 [Burkholderiales bacterium RIFCSPHIGHO2_12_FULL_61_11]|nr:MAG: hypothetical protein A3E79_17720 [Burkholderiales bacterium RIFCSPHIGHO2_12_FULL_61_11]
MNRRNLPLIALRSFEAVARHMSMKHAAAELGVTPGAVSQQIRSIEGRMQVDLFVRRHRQLELTNDGTMLYRTLRRNFTEIEQTLDQITSGPTSKKIRLKLLPSLAIRWLVPRLASFYGQHPGYDVEVATGMSVDDMSVDDVDFTCRLGTGKWEGLDATWLFSDAFIPVCAPALGLKIERLSDLLLYPLLHSMMRMDAWQIWFKQNGVGVFKPKAEIKFANAALAYQAAEDGLGIAIAQQAYVGSDLATGRLVVPFGRAAHTSLSYYLVCSSHKAQHPKNRVFSQWISSIAETK